MPESIFDLETRASADLKKVGAYAYAEHPQTEIASVCAAPADDDAPPPVFAVDLHEVGGPEHQQVAAGLDRGFAGLGGANSANFDRQFREKLRRLGFRVPDDPMAYTQDIAPRAIAAGLPAGLDHLSKALGLGDQGKASNAAMKIFSRLDRSGKFVHLNGHPRADEFLHYARQDVVATRLAHRMLPRLSPFEQQVHAATLRMNDRGIAIDRDLCINALEAHRRATAPWASELLRITGCTASQAVALKGWFRQQGLPINSVDARTIDLIAGDPDAPEIARLAARLKASIGGSAIKKFQAALDQVCADGRLRGSFSYYGAITGRWASRGVQLQNMARPTVPKDQIGIAIELLRSALLDIFDLMFDQPAAVLGSTVRGLLVGNRLVVVDLSRIELVTLLAAAGASHRLQGDPYKTLAALLFAVVIELVTAEQRQSAKPVVLGCFDEKTKVLTDRGWVRITKVKRTDKVWDGIEFVAHAGVVAKGLKWTIEHHGLAATPDHKILTNTGWSEWQAVVSQPSLFQSALALASSLSCATSGAPTEPGANPFSRSASASAGGWGGWTRSTCAPGGLLDATAAQKSSLPVRIGLGISKFWMTLRTAPDWAIGYLPSFQGAPTRGRTDGPAMVVEGSPSTSRGWMTGPVSWLISSLCPAGITSPWRSTASTTTEAMSPGICGSWSAGQTTQTGAAFTPSSAKSTGCVKKTQTYDVTCAGPRSRYTVWTDQGPLIVHNSGYCLGPAGLVENLAKQGITVTLEWATAAIAAYARTFPEVPRLWAQLTEAAASCIQSGKEQPAGCARAFFRMRDGHLQMVLPSERAITYREPTVHPGIKWGRTVLEITYMAPADSGAMVRTHLGASTLTENLASGMARDVLAHALVQADADGLNPVGTVHDELICESTHPDALAHLQDIMTRTPPWAEGLGMVLGAEGFSAARYRK